jgi:hypothetical protein
MIRVENLAWMILKKRSFRVMIPQICSEYYHVYYVIDAVDEEEVKDIVMNGYPEESDRDWKDGETVDIFYEDMEILGKD